jgi:hypothetical protein
VTNNHYCRNVDLERLGEHVYSCKVCKITHKVLVNENKEAIGVKTVETRS